MAGIRVNLPTPADAVAVCRNAAHRMQGARWDNMSSVERELARDLIRLGYLTDNEPPNGYTGLATQPPYYEVMHEN